MDTWQAERMARGLMDEFGLEQWTFRWDNAKKRFGCCRRNKKEISLSKPLTILNLRLDVSDVIRHEIAHALAPPQSHHDAAWQAQCLITGARPERCYDEAVMTPPAPYRVECPQCGILGSRHRKPRRPGAYHPACGSPVRFVRVA